MIKETRGIWPEAGSQRLGNKHTRRLITIPNNDSSAMSTAIVTYADSNILPLSSQYQ
jgi:hypothetical protein